MFCCLIGEFSFGAGKTVLANVSSLLACCFMLEQSGLAHWFQFSVVLLLGSQQLQFRCTLLSEDELSGTGGAGGKKIRGKNAALGMLWGLWKLLAQAREKIES